MSPVYHLSLQMVALLAGCLSRVHGSAQLCHASSKLRHLLLHLKLTLPPGLQLRLQDLHMHA